MLGFLQARLPGADGKPDPEKIKAFTEANPETTKQGKWLASQPVVGSWVGVTYWGIHAYTLTNASGASQVIKFKMVPTAGAVALTDEEAKAKPADFLVDELAGRLASKAPTSFDMVAILGRAGDATTDPTERWIDEDARPTVTLGTLAIAAVEKNASCDDAIFDPTNLAKGIEGAKDDTLLPARTPAYAISISVASDVVLEHVRAHVLTKAALLVSETHSRERVTSALGGANSPLKQATAGRPPCL